VNRVLIAALKQELLKRDRRRIEHEIQETENGGVEADAPRTLEVDVKVEYALVLVELGSRVAVRPTVAVVCRHEASRILTDSAHVSKKVVHDVRFDATLEDGEAGRRECLDAFGLFGRHALPTDRLREVFARSFPQRPQVHERWAVLGAERCF
jgi:hypothetical protein